MSNGGMIQHLTREGDWTDAFAVSYKPEATAMRVAFKTQRPVRIIQRDGTVIYEFDPAHTTPTPSENQETSG